ncbi:PREDICTED: ATP-dependent RNA helicase DDX51-like [Branchiostoma belcheri]|uniref:ATP-dependent RNA helicase n=1 Tax=Branchiostoma belcheri TaxID=7741 RepID=A0A6P4YG99_BRABE|nr:PREDICTED: ATP-dependent RNA helicase DDX51-like [Branchiostoma belcheri]
MALFTVNRYLGEEEDVATYSSSRGLHGNQSANDILAKLHKDARQRQEKSIQNGPATSQSSVDTTVDKTTEKGRSKDEPTEVAKKGLKKRKKEQDKKASRKSASNEELRVSSSCKDNGAMSPKLKKRKQEVQESSSGNKKFKPSGKTVEENNSNEAEEEMPTSQKIKVSSKKKNKGKKETLVPKSAEMPTSKKPNKDNEITSMSEANDPISSEPLVTKSGSTIVNGQKKKTDKTKSMKEQKRKKNTNQTEENDGIQVEVSQTSIKEAAMGKKKKAKTEKGEVKNGEETTPKMDKLNKAKAKKAKSEETSSMADADTDKKQSKQNKQAKRDNSTDNDAKDTITEDMDYESQGSDFAKETYEELSQASQKDDKTPNKQSKKQKNKKDEDEESEAFQVLGEVQKNKAEKVHRKLPDWLADPSVIENDIQSNLVPIEDTPCIGEFLRNKLKENGVENFFPVQHQVIPAILEDAQDGTIMGRAGFRPSDICVSAPTGSGKTLAFVIPVVQALLQRVVCEVRALVVLPTKDLAVQIYKVFNHYTSGSRLKVANCSGQKSLAVERNALVRESRGVYQSLADIVVATPGRLVDHIEKTAGFSLRHLRYLVIDEADRMLDQIKQDWLAKVTRAVYEGQGSEDKPGIPMSLWAGVLGGRTEPGPLTAANAAKMQQPLQKLLFSATLSQNPEKLQQLNLFHPRLFTSVVRHGQRKQETASPGALQDKGTFVGKFTTPAGLKEYTVSCTAADKPLVVLHLLLNQKFQHVLCFTGSLESTHRLYLLAKLFGGVTVAEFSSNLPPERRTKILTKFRTGKIQLIVCSDAMARGMDVEGVEVVISYDVPPYVKTYIHRVGRTARAGKEGTAFSLVLQEEEKRFRRMLKQAGKDEPQPWSLSGTDLQPLVPRYQKTLQRLQKTLKVEAKTK